MGPRSWRWEVGRVRLLWLLMFYSEREGGRFILALEGGGGGGWGGVEWSGKQHSWGKAGEVGKPAGGLAWEFQAAGVVGGGHGEPPCCFAWLPSGCSACSVQGRISATAGCSGIRYDSEGTIPPPPQLPGI